MERGKVYLVGAGPGDSKLMTVKGLECIRKAEVILYDRLVNPVLLEEARSDVELIYCGKLPHRHILRQESINELLVQKGKEGKIVVRLKGGDPSVFGRVGEEAKELKEHGVPYEIVPGITAGIAASTYAGIPVTHRDYGASFAIVTGHDKSSEGKPLINWQSLADGIDTIAFYMGVGNIAHISEQLMKHGRSPSTPVILIQWGTYGRQKTLEGTLRTIVSLVEREKFQNPAITLVGNIVTLREKLKWFEETPLFGRNILLARATSEKGTVSDVLREQGAEVFEFPRFESRLIDNLGEVSTILENLLGYEQILFSSPEAVSYFFQLLNRHEIDIRQIKANFFAGSFKSSHALRQYGCISKLKEDLKVSSQLLIVGESLSIERQEQLNNLYNTFDYLPTHEQKLVEQSLVTFQRIETEQAINTVVLPSAASVEKLYQAMKRVLQNPLAFFENKQVIAFGQSSKERAKQLGIRVDITLDQPTTAHLLDCLQTKEVIR